MTKLRFEHSWRYVIARNASGIFSVVCETREEMSHHETIEEARAAKAKYEATFDERDGEEEDE